jgi:hypothetical protein
VVLLTKQEAQDLIQKAYSMNSQYGRGFRLGQAISNLLPIDLYQHMCGSTEDFFYVFDNEKAIELFYTHCVGD